MNRAELRMWRYVGQCLANVFGVQFSVLYYLFLALISTYKLFSEHVYRMQIVQQASPVRLEGFVSLLEHANQPMFKLCSYPSSYSKLLASIQPATSRSGMVIYLLNSWERMTLAFNVANANALKVMKYR